MRKKIAAGNWKMNLTFGEAQELVQAVVASYTQAAASGVELIMAPPYPYLLSVKEWVGSAAGIHVAAQNLHHEASGAYTGEVAAGMLNSIGITHCIIGHSERRAYFGENNALLATKIDQALAHGLVPIYCIGEKLEEREAGHALEVNKVQLQEGCFHLDAEAFSKLILAYEPVWAIGTGKTASPEQAEEVHAFIRQEIAGKYGAAIAEETSILYGGSVKPGNAAELFAQPNIDGGLIGGASLKAADFLAIAQAL